MFLLEGNNPIIFGIIVLILSLIWAGRRKSIPPAQKTTTTPGKGKSYK